MNFSKGFNSILFLSVLVVSCSNQVPNKVVFDSNVDMSKTTLPKQDNLFVADIGKGIKGASFNVNVVFSDNFTTKAVVTADGKVAKVVSDISKYKVYLLLNSSTSAYPSSGDPLKPSSSSGDMVAGPFDITKSGASQTIKFDNVPISTPNAYYVAVRALDSSDNDILKRNTSWGTTTDTVAQKRVSVSNGAGIVVDSDFKVSSTTNLVVEPQLDDATGATIGADITPSPGTTTIGAIDAF